MIDPSLLDVTITLHLEPDDLQILGHALCARACLAKALATDFRTSESAELDGRLPTTAEVQDFCREELRTAFDQLAVDLHWRRQKYARQQRTKRGLR